MKTENQSKLESGKRARFGILALLLLVALIASSHAVVMQLGFGDFYYTNNIANETRRVGFALVLAFSIFASTNLAKNPTDPIAWVGLRVLLTLTTVLMIKYFFLPEFPTDFAKPIEPPPPIYAKLFATVPCLAIGVSLVAVYHARFAPVWMIALVSSMVVELVLLFKLMIVSRAPESFWVIYDSFRSYELAINSLGIAAVLVLLVVSVRERYTLMGGLASLVFLTIPIGECIYEWIVVG